MPPHCPESPFINAEHTCQVPITEDAILIRCLSRPYGAHRLVNETDVEASTYHVKETVMCSWREEGNIRCLFLAWQGRVGSRVV